MKKNILLNSIQFVDKITQIAIFVNQINKMKI
jgi:hypothetical protein